MICKRGVLFETYLPSRSDRVGVLGYDVRPMLRVGVPAALTLCISSSSSAKSISLQVGGLVTEIV